MSSLGYRKSMNGVATIVCLALTILAVWPLFSVLWTVFEKGLPVVNVEFLTALPRPPLLPGGGIQHAIIGTLLVVGMGTAIGAPVGIMAGIYLSEYGRSRFAEAVRTFADAMSGLPSILAGLFAYAVLVREIGFSAYAGGFALSLLMIPVVARTTEEALRTVPTTYRDAALALGVPRWRAILTVVLPAASAAILTGLLLAVARIAGETAPLLMTVLTSFYLVTDPSEPVATLPYLVYDYGKSAYTTRMDQAWGAALVLIGFVLIVNIVVRLLGLRRRRFEG